MLETVVDSLAPFFVPSVFGLIYMYVTVSKLEAKMDKFEKLMVQMNETQGDIKAINKEILNLHQRVERLERLKDSA